MAFGRRIFKDLARSLCKNFVRASQKSFHTSTSTTEHVQYHPARTFSELFSCTRSRKEPWEDVRRILEKISLKDFAPNLSCHDLERKKDLDSRTCYKQLLQRACESTLEKEPCEIEKSRSCRMSRPSQCGDTAGEHFKACKNRSLNPKHESCH